MVRDPAHDDHSAASRVYLTRAARAALARLEPARRASLSAAFERVGHELLQQGQQVQVAADWSRGTWPRRRYPQQCYPRTLKYVRDHADILGMRLVHGVISHQMRLAPLDHAWVELPDEVIFDGVVQAFFTRKSYNAVMSPMCLDSYSAAESERLHADQHHPGPWNARWVPTPLQLEAYAAAIGLPAEMWKALARPA